MKLSYPQHFLHDIENMTPDQARSLAVGIVTAANKAEAHQ